MIDSATAIDSSCKDVKAPLANAKVEKEEEHVWLIYAGTTYHVPMSFIRRHPRGRQLILPYANRDMTAAYDSAGHSKGAMRSLKKFASDAMSVEELDRIYAEKSEAFDQALWNACVRVGCLLSVVTVLGAVYLRCRRQSA